MSDIQDKLRQIKQKFPFLRLPEKCEFWSDARVQLQVLELSLDALAMPVGLIYPEKGERNPGLVIWEFWLLDEDDSNVFSDRSCFCSDKIGLEPLGGMLLRISRTEGGDKWAERVHRLVYTSEGDAIRWRRKKAGRRIRVDKIEGFDICVFSMPRSLTLSQLLMCYCRGQRRGR